MWKSVKQELPKNQSLRQYMVFGTWNKGTKHEIRCRSRAFFESGKWCDAHGEDLRGENESVEYWFDDLVYPDPE